MAVSDYAHKFAFYAIPIGVRTSFISKEKNKFIPSFRRDIILSNKASRTDFAPAVLIRKAKAVIIVRL